MTPLELTCPICFAPPGQECIVNSANDGIDHMRYQEVYGKQLHFARIDEAAAATRVSDPVDVASFEKAVES